MYGVAGGRVWDSKLTWKDNLDILVEECRKRIDILTALAQIRLRC